MCLRVPLVLREHRSSARSAAAPRRTGPPPRWPPASPASSARSSTTSSAKNHNTDLQTTQGRAARQTRQDLPCSCAIVEARATRGGSTTTSNIRFTIGSKHKGDDNEEGKSDDVKIWRMALFEDYCCHSLYLLLLIIVSQQLWPYHVFSASITIKSSELFCLNTCFICGSCRVFVNWWWNSLGVSFESRINRSGPGGCVRGLVTFRNKTEPYCKSEVAKFYQLHRDSVGVGPR